MLSNQTLKFNPFHKIEQMAVWLGSCTTHNIETTTTSTHMVGRVEIVIYHFVPKHISHAEAEIERHRKTERKRQR